jgi:hypothetical protein
LGETKTQKHGRRIKIDSNNSRGALPDGYNNGLTAAVALELAHARNLRAENNLVAASSRHLGAVWPAFQIVK